MLSQVSQLYGLVPFHLRKSAFLKLVVSCSFRGMAILKRSIEFVSTRIIDPGGPCFFKQLWPVHDLLGGFNPLSGTSQPPSFHCFQLV